VGRTRKIVLVNELGAATSVADLSDAHAVQPDLSRRRIWHSGHRS
jgi:hypothetical protein